ncbi:MAG: mechanosensitive ion channel domain-containing protein [Bacteroidota bacterium]
MSYSFDKPFEVGDSINIDDKNGTIEFIGLKTTRLRSVSGEQIVISNSDLTKSRVHNFKRQGDPEDQIQSEYFFSYGH